MSDNNPHSDDSDPEQRPNTGESADKLISRRNWLAGIAASPIALAAQAQASGDTAPGTRKWQFTTRQEPYLISSPTVTDRRVYIMLSRIFPGSSGYGSVISVNRTTGEYEWDFRVNEGEPTQSTPTVVNGSVYIGSKDSNVYSLNAETGEQEWGFKTRAPVASSPTVADGTVYFGSEDGGLYAIDAESGTEKWQRFRTENKIQTSPTVANGTVYIGSNDANLYAVDAATGEQEWSFDTGDTVMSSATAASGTVFVGSLTGRFHAVDAATGAEKWRFETGGRIESSPTVANGTVYFGSKDKNLYAVDTATGEKNWIFLTTGEVNSSPTVADGAVYVGSDDNYLYAVDAAKGTQKWSHDTTVERGYDTVGVVSSSPTVANGTVFIGSEDYGEDGYGEDGSGGVMAIEAEGTRSSTGSRVILGTLGTIGSAGPRSEGSSEAGQLSIEENSIRMSRTAVGLAVQSSQGQTANSTNNPAVEVTVSNAEAVFAVPDQDWYTDAIELEPVPTRESPMNGTESTPESGPEDTQHYRAEIPVPGSIPVGTWVSVTIVAQSSTGSEASVTQYREGDIVDGTIERVDGRFQSQFIEDRTIGFGVFEHVLSGPMHVIASNTEFKEIGTPEMDLLTNDATFDQAEAAPPQEVYQWERSCEHDVNRYLISDRSTMGTIGVSFEFDDNNGKGHSVGESFEYYKDRTKVDSLTEDLESSMGRSVTQTENADFYGITHAGESAKRARGSFDPDSRVIYTPRLEMTQQHQLLTFAEEVLHSYGYLDLYGTRLKSSKLGQLKDRLSTRIVGNLARVNGTLDLFGSVGVSRNTEYQEFIRLSTGTRISKTLNLYGNWSVDSAQDILTTNPVGLGADWESQTPTNSPTTIELEVPRLDTYDIDGEAPVLLDTDTPDEKSPDSTYVIPEYRDGIKGSGGNDKEGTEDGAIVLYRARPHNSTPLTDVGPSYSVVTDPQSSHPRPLILVPDTGPVTISPGLGIEHDLEFTMEDTDSPSATVRVRKTVPESDTGGLRRALLKPLTFGNGPQEARQPATQIRLQTPSVRATDEQGRVTGYTDSGEYVRQIPGSEASGDQQGGIESIGVPSEVDAEFEVVYPSQDGESETDPENPDSDSDSDSESLLSYCEIEITEYPVDAELVQSDGGTTVSGTETVEYTGALAPGEVSKPATLDTFSDRSEGFSDGIFGYDSIPLIGAGGGIAAAAGAAYLLKRRMGGGDSSESE